MDKDLNKIYRVRAEFVGINQYSDALFGREMQLRYACNDALEMAGVVRCAEPFLIDRDCFNTHTDAQATHDVVLPALNQVFAPGRPVEKDVLALFYFSGHGVTHPVDDKVFLCCHDVNLKNPYSGGISLNQIYEYLQKSSAGHSVAIIDACFSGAMTDIKRVEHLTPVELARRSMSSLLDKNEKNIAIFLSSRGNQPSRESEQRQHGIYTYEVLKGWRDGEACDREGSVTLSGLKAYLEKRFEKDRQKPLSSVLGGESLLIGQGKPQATLPDVRPIAPADLPKPLTHVGGRIQIATAPQTGTFQSSASMHNRRQLLKSLTIPIIIAMFVLFACAISTIFVEPLRLGFLALIFGLSLGLSLASLFVSRIAGAILLPVQLLLASGFAYAQFHWGANVGALTGVLGFLAGLQWLFWLILGLEVVFSLIMAVDASLR